MQSIRLLRITGFWYYPLQDREGLSAGRAVALVFGNEVTGASDEVFAICDACVEIPRFGSKHSFNIGVTEGRGFVGGGEGRIVSNKLKLTSVFNQKIVNLV